ncbi:MAG: glycosyltransferase family 2 protein [Sulfitobacter sp.]
MTQLSRQASDHPKAPHVCILLALYNGAAHLQDQLDSFARQSHANWSLYVSDDGSTDDGPAIVEQFCKDHPNRKIVLLNGPQKGFVANFLFLLKSAPQSATYVAFSDQDDVWFDGKLARATDALSSARPDQPALYCARTVICNRHLTPFGLSAPITVSGSFKNALVQSIAGGNTMVLNAAALTLAKQLMPRHNHIVSHDWWLYQVLSGCDGLIVKDNDPVLYYRQHDNNLIGSNRSFFAKIRRIQALLVGQYRRWNRINLATLTSQHSHLNPEAQTVLQQFVAARAGSLRTRLANLHKSGVHRQSRTGTAALYLACMLNRL